MFTFQRYGKDGDIEDVVIWEDDDDYEKPENDNFDEDKEGADNDVDPNELCIEVSDDDEHQKEFFSAFHQVGHRIKIG